MANKTTESAYEIFMDLIENEMAHNEFWEWVAGWKDAGAIIEEAQEWDEGIMIEEIRNYIDAKGGCKATDWTQRACATLDKLG
jgi:hypothetical protein